MKKLILLGIIAAVALAGFYYFFPQAFSQPAADNSPKHFSSVDELNSFINANSQPIYGGSVSGVMTAGGAVPKAASQTSAQRAAPSSGAVSGSTPDFSGTNMQVAGVDESDIVKSDGKYIYAVSGNNVSIMDAYPAESAKIVSTISFNGSVSGIYVSGDRLVVFGQNNYGYAVPVAKAAVGAPLIASESIMRPYYYSPRTLINVYDISDRSNPSLARNISVDGSYYDSRMIGDYVYVIANQPVYNYGGGPVPLPAVYSGGAARETPIADIYYFGMPDSSYIFTNVLALNAQNNDEPSSKTFLMGYSQSIFVSADNIYLTYPKYVSELQFYDRIVGEVIMPSVPADIQSQITDVRNSNASSYDKMQEIGKIFQDYIGTLNPEQGANVMKGVEERTANLQNEIAKETEKTVVHKIAISGGKIDYMANGEVPGIVLNQFSMDESNGYFRIATTTSGNSWFGGFGMAAGGVATTGAIQTSVSERVANTGSVQTQTESQTSEKMVEAAAESPRICPAVCVPLWTVQNNECVFNECGSGCGPDNITSFSTEAECKSAPAAGIAEEKQKRISPQPAQPVVAPSGPLNHLYVLDGGLNIAGKLEDLASGERIYSVRFIGDKAYMVTFRQVDPLFVIDLSSPQDPKVLGYLKVPGVSDYLHPYDATHIIGLGRDASENGRITGMKLSLFDVSDFANPKEISKYIIGGQGTYSEALYDHKAFLFSAEKNLLVIPVSECNYSAFSYQCWPRAYVFNIDLANGIALKGTVTHTNATNSSDYYYDYNSQIRRSLYIGDVLYTISNKMVKMNSLSDLAEINKISLPFSQESYPIIY